MEVLGKSRKGQTAYRYGIAEIIISYMGVQYNIGDLLIIIAVSGI